MKLDAALKAVVVSAGLVLVIVGLRESGAFFLPLLTALFLAVISTPIVRFLEVRARMPWAIAIMLTLVLDMGLVAGFGALLWTSLAGLEEALPRYQQGLTSLAHDLVLALRGWGFDVDDEVLGQIQSGDRMMSVVGDVVSQVTEIVGNVVLVILLLGFLLFESRGATKKVQLLLGRANPHIDRMTTAAVEVQRYLVVKTVLSVLTAVLTGCWMAACGVDFPLLWGLLTFLLNYIPSLGPAIAVIPPVIVATLTLGPGGAAAVAAGQLSIGFVIGNVLEPRMMGHTLGLSTLVVFVSMFFWGWLWGPVGALFAVPLTMLFRSALETNEDTRWIAVLLGSGEYVEQKRREWGWQTIDEKEQGKPAPPPAPEPPRTPIGLAKRESTGKTKNEAAE